MSGNTTQSNTAVNRRMRAGAVVTAVAFAVTGAVPGMAAATERYKVARGDTLASIAEKFGYTAVDGWRRIYDANPKLENPDLIVPGQKLTIPAKDERVKRRSLPETTAPRREASTSRSSTATSYSAPSGSVWTALASCESGGNWAANTGNGYYGGLQFSLSSWQAVGGTGYPHQASPSTQIAMAQRLQARQGWGAWPACSAKLGLR